MHLTQLETTYMKRPFAESTVSHFIAVTLCFCRFLHEINQKCMSLHVLVSLSHFMNGAVYFCKSLHKSADFCTKTASDLSYRPDLGVERGVAG